MKKNVRINGIEVEVCENFLERARGLIARPAPAEGRGLLIPKCNAVHTCFMRYPIDVTFLDRKGEVVRTVRDVRPWRLFVWGGFRAYSALETKSRCCKVSPPSTPRVRT